MVLATDMANHFDILSKFKSTFMGVTADAPAEQRLAPHMELILQMVIKCADLGHCTMMRRTHLFWSKSLEAEFFAQGDLEKADGAKPSELSPLTDRDQPGKRCVAVLRSGRARAAYMSPGAARCPGGGCGEKAHSSATPPLVYCVPPPG